MSRLAPGRRKATLYLPSHILRTSPPVWGSRLCIEHDCRIMQRPRLSIESRLSYWLTASSVCTGEASGGEMAEGMCKGVK